MILATYQWRKLEHRWLSIHSLICFWEFSPIIILSWGTCLDRELAPNDPALGPIGLPPWLEGCTSVRRWSGDLAAAIGWEVAVKLAKGLWTRDWVDIIKTSIRIWPIRSLKSEYTTGGKKKQQQSYYMQSSVSLKTVPFYREHIRSTCYGY